MLRVPWLPTHLVNLSMVFSDYQILCDIWLRSGIALGKVR